MKEIGSHIIVEIYNYDVSGMLPQTEIIRKNSPCVQANICVQLWASHPHGETGHHRYHIEGHWFVKKKN